MQKEHRPGNGRYFAVFVKWVEDGIGTIWSRMQSKLSRRSCLSQVCLCTSGVLAPGRLRQEGHELVDGPGYTERL